MENDGYSDSDSGSGSETSSLLDGFPGDPDPDIVPPAGIVEVNGTTQSYTKQGELYKQGGVNRNQGWKKRFMKFDGQTLRYYKTRNSPVSLRIIPVGIMLNIQPANSARAHQFELECVNRTFLFATDDLNNAQQWQSFLMAAIIDHKKHGEKLVDGGEMCNPDICGSIKFDKNGKKYFVAIKGDKFRYYYNEQDYRIDSPIHELSIQLLNVKEIEKEPTKLKLSSPPNQHIILNFNSVDEATEWQMEITEAIERVLGDDEAIDDITRLPANQTCADCSSSRVGWASINFGIVLCAKCAGIHRGFGATVSKVRSIRMDNIFKNNKCLLEMFQVLGNKNANAFWSKHPPSDINPELGMCVGDRKIYLTRKYLKRLYADLQKDEINQLNKVLLAAVRVNDIQTAMSCLFSGAEISDRDEDGKTAIEIADSLGHSILKEFLSQNENIVLPTLFVTTNGHIQMQNLPKKTAIYYDGYLEKTGPNMKGYLKRWFVLHYCILSYYQEKGKASAKGTININDDIVSVSSSFSTDREHVFEMGCKANRRVYRFAAPDAESRTAWMSALVKVICPTEILPEQIEECSTLAFAGVFYVKFEQAVWRRTWITLTGSRLDIWKMDDMTHCLTINITKATKLFKYNSGRSSKLLNASEDFRLLDGNQCIELVTDQRLTKFQGLLVKDTDKVYAYVDRLLTQLTNG